VLDLPELFAEIKEHEGEGLVGCESRLIISSRAHLGQYNNIAAAVGQRISVIL